MADAKVADAAPPAAAAAAAAAAPAAAAAAAPAPAAAAAAAAAGAGKFADVPPNPTIYVHGLNEKVKKEELKKSLYHVFSQFGNVLEVQAHKTYKLRGQAWVIFEDLSGATKAIKEMTNFNFYGKPMKVQFARVKSDVISKADGSFVARPKRKVDGKDKKQKKQKAADKLADEPPAKKLKTESGSAKAGDGKDGGAASSHLQQVMMQTMEQLPPNRTLFVENLPAAATQLMVAMLFQQYNGYMDARVPEGKGIAFVEFQDSYQSGAAMQALQGFKITPTNLMKISFARA